MHEMDRVQSRASETTEEMRASFFGIMERVPSQFYYFGAMVSLIGSAFMYMQKRWEWAVFLGQLAPTFLVLPLFHRLLRPSSESMIHPMEETGQQARRTVEEYLRRYWSLPPP